MEFYYISNNNFTNIILLYLYGIIHLLIKLCKRQPNLLQLFDKTKAGNVITDLQTPRSDAPMNR